MTGQTFNIQTLSGLALSIGILVDEATVCIENMHSHLAAGAKKHRAVFDACVETMVPRLLAMLSVVAVFIPSFFMVGITRDLFIPLSLAVGFAMVASTTLASTLVPILAVWVLKDEHKAPTGPDFIDHVKDSLGNFIRFLMPLRIIIIPVYVVWSPVRSRDHITLPTSIGYPAHSRSSGSKQFRVRISAPTGMRVEALEKRVLTTIEEIKKEAGPGVVEKTLGYAGQQPAMFPISSAFLWTSGPHQAVLDVQLKEDSKIDMPPFKDRLRARLAKALPDTTFSFEPGDIVSQIMNLGSPTPITVRISGHDLDSLTKYSGQQSFRTEMKKIQELA